MKYKTTIPNPEPATGLTPAVNPVMPPKLRRITKSALARAAWRGWTFDQVLQQLAFDQRAVELFDQHPGALIELWAEVCREVENRNEYELAFAE